MKVNIVAVGKIYPKQPEYQIIQNYLDRIKYKCNVIEVGDSNVKEKYNKQKMETNKIIQTIEKIKGNNYNILLDVNGIQYDTTKFAQKIQKILNLGVDNINIIIGGAFGNSQHIIEYINEKISMGKMTWNHLLARVMICEQLYRIYSLHVGHPYHK